MCAAPGGKATQAGAFIGKNGLLVENEIVKNRANILSDNIDRFGLKMCIRDSPVTVPTQDMILGSYYLTIQKEHYDRIIDTILDDEPKINVLILSLIHI